MKNSIYALTIIGFCFLFACSDNEGLLPVVNEPDAVGGEAPELIPVSFDLGFSKDIIDMRSSANLRSTTDVFPLKYIDYFIFDDLGFLYKRNTLTDSDGSFSEELPEGKYTFAFVGYNSGTLSASGTKIITTSYQIHVLEADGEVADQFYKKFDYTVKKDESNTIQVALERNVGRVEIVLADAIPSEVVSISLRVHHYFNGYRIIRLNDGTISTNTDYVRDIAIPESDKGVGFKISFLSYENTPNSEDLSWLQSLDVTLTAKSADASQPIVAAKRITVEEVLKNKTVRYNGKLFDEDGGFEGGDGDYYGNGSFQVTIDDNWGETIDKPL